VRKVAVPADGARIRWTRPSAIAAEAGFASVRFVHQYIAGSLSGFIETGRARGARCRRQEGPAAWDGVIQWLGLARAQAAGPLRRWREPAPA